MKKITVFAGVFLSLSVLFNLLAPKETKAATPLTLTCTAHYADENHLTGRPFYWKLTASGGSAGRPPYVYSAVETTVGTANKASEFKFGDDTIYGTISAVYYTPGVKTFTATVQSGKKETATTTCQATFTQSPPETPSIVSAKMIPISACQTQAKLMWGAVSGATGYKVYRTSAAQNFVPTQVATTTTAEYVIDQFLVGDYSYQVASYSAAGTSALTPGLVSAAPSNQCFSVTCEASPVAPLVGQQVTWRVMLVGGAGSYKILSWSGESVVSPSLPYLRKTYTSVGDRSMTVKVSSGTQTASATCNVSVVPSSSSFPIRLSMSKANACSAEDIQLSWVKNFNNSAIDFYRIYKTSPDSTSPNTFVGIAEASPAINYFIDTPVAPGIHKYKIEGVSSSTDTVVSSNTTVLSVSDCPSDLGNTNNGREKRPPYPYNEASSKTAYDKQAEVAQMGISIQQSPGGSFSNYTVYVKEIGYLKNPQFDENLFFVDGGPVKFPYPTEGISPGKRAGITLYSGADANPDPKDSGVSLQDFGGVVGKLWVKNLGGGATSKPFGTFFNAIINPLPIPAGAGLKADTSWTAKDFAKIFFRLKEITMNGSFNVDAKYVQTAIKTGAESVTDSTNFSGSNSVNILLRTDESEALTYARNQVNPEAFEKQYTRIRTSSKTGNVNTPGLALFYLNFSGMTSGIMGGKPFPLFDTEVSLESDYGFGFSPIYAQSENLVDGYFFRCRALGIDDPNNCEYDGMKPSDYFKQDRKSGYSEDPYTAFGHQDRVYYENYNITDQGSNSTVSWTNNRTTSAKINSIVGKSYLTYGGLYDASTGEEVNLNQPSSGYAANTDGSNVAQAPAESAPKKGWLSRQVANVAFAFKSVIAFFGGNNTSTKLAGGTSGTKASAPTDLNFRAEKANWTVFGGCQDINPGNVPKDKVLAMTEDPILKMDGDPTRPRVMFTPTTPSIALAENLTVCERPLAKNMTDGGYNETNTVYTYSEVVTDPLTGKAKTVSHKDYFRDRDSWHELYVAYPMPEAFSKRPDIVEGTRNPNRATLRNYYMVIQNERTGEKTRAIIIDKGPTAKDITKSGRFIKGRPDTIDVSMGVQRYLKLQPGDKINAWVEKKEIPEVSYMWLSADFQD